MGAVAARPGDQRGSVLVVALILVMSLTILGLALFDLAQIESQLGLTSATDARAFEVAQAGLERGIRALRDGFLADPWGTESWADGANGPTCTPSACDASQFRQLSLADATLPASGADPGGPYVVEMKLVLVAEANNPISQGAAYTYPYGQTCIPDTATPAVCANLAFLRSTGTVTGPPGYTRSRTVQSLVRAAPTSYFAAAVTAGVSGAADPVVDGRVVIGGSVQALGDANSAPAIRLDGGASYGIRNNWADLWNDAADGRPAFDRIAPHSARGIHGQAICPPLTSCAGGANLVESLGAEVRVVGNITSTMVTANNATSLGTSANTAAYGPGNRVGKGRLDGTYLSQGCALPCTGLISLNGGSTLSVDYGNITRPFPIRPPRLPLSKAAVVDYPAIGDSVRIAGVTYANWSTNFFQPRAYNLSSLPANGGSCGAAYQTASPLGQFFAGGAGLRDQNGVEAYDGFCHQFTYQSKAGASVTAEICWRRRPTKGPPANTSRYPLDSLGAPVDRVLEFGSPTCDVPTGPGNPVLIYQPDFFRIGRDAGPDRYQYRGWAIVFAALAVSIEETVDSYCAKPTGTACGVDLNGTGERFPDDNALFILTTQNVTVAFGGPTPLRVMAYIFTSTTFSMQREAYFVGAVRGNNVCFNNASSSVCAVTGSGPAYPRVFQAPFPDPRRIPEELPASNGPVGDRWLVQPVPLFWRECAPGALPATPTGSCGY